MEESIVERHPDRETATFAVSVRASRASDAPLPQPDALDLYQGDELTTQCSFVVQWQEKIDL